ncbi:Cytochrome c7 c [uncultured archaeon]|nr:Cytochrome c7 c [uncultured archaeon]
MKKFLLLVIILTGLAVYSSIQVISYISKPAVCIDCHGSKYNATAKGSILPSHTNSSITCIDCHSGNGIQARIDTLNVVAGAKILNESKPVINQLFQANFSFVNSSNNTRFSLLKENCVKCHPESDLKGQMHANNTTCNLCHFAHTKQNINFEAIGIQTHKNVKCTACHGTGTDIQIPSCTQCHEPHVKDATWGNDVCLGCHKNAHIPTRSMTFSGNEPKELCKGCHPSEYQNLTTNGGKHNLLPSCTSCHPAHGVIMECLDCHGDTTDEFNAKHYPHHQNACTLCHRYVAKCTACHNPHNPFSGLPRPATDQQIAEIAKQRAQILTAPTPHPARTPNPDE